MKASRRSRGASEMRKEREKREAEKNKKRKKKKKRGLLARTIGSLAGCTRARSYVSRLACGLEKRQQNGRSGGRWESGGMRLELEVRKDEGREDVGLDLENGKMTEMRREDVLERFLLVDFRRMVGSDTWWEDDALWILKKW